VSVSVARSERAGRSLYGFLDFSTRTHVHVRRKGGSLHFTVKRPGTTRSFNLKSTGSDRLDRAVGFLVLLITTGTGKFRFNTFGTSRLAPVKKQLGWACPDLVSNDPADAFITEFLAVHVPSGFLLPAGREYVETVARAVRASSEDYDLAGLMGRVESTYDVYRTVYDLVVAGAHRLGLDLPEMSNVFKLLAQRSLSKHYRELIEKRKPYETGWKLERFENIFVNEYSLFLVSHLDYLNRQLGQLMRRAFPYLVSSVRVEKRDDDTYMVVIVLSRPGRPRLTINLSYTTGRLLSVFVPFPFEKTGETILRRFLNNAEELVPSLDENDNVLLVTMPGRAVLLDLSGHDYKVYTSFRELRETLGHAKTDVYRLHFEVLDRLGDEFYGSPTLRRAVSIIGCLTCTDYELLGEHVALAKTRNGKWLAALVQVKTKYVFWKEGRTPEEAVRRLLPLLFSVLEDDDELGGAEKYVPGVARLRQAGEKLAETVGGDGLIIDEPFLSRPFDGVALDISTVPEGNYPGSTDQLAKAYVFDGKVPEEERIELVRRMTNWYRLLELDPSAEEILLGLGYRKATRARKNLIFTDGNVYLAVRVGRRSRP